MPVTLLLLVTLFPGLVAAEPFALHEWGTFTSLQGAKGSVRWRPDIGADLPLLVESRPLGNSTAFPALLSKTRQAAFQRMETPVIYLHGNPGVPLRIRVGFPQGVFSEWYPPPTSAARLATLDQPPVAGDWIEWADITVPDTGASGFAQAEANGQGAHYFAARTAEATPMRVRVDNSAHDEGFLFYRGLGHFTGPLRAIPDAGSGIDLLWDDSRAGGPGIVIEIANGRLRWMTVPTGAERFHVELSSQPWTTAVDPVRHHLLGLLVTAGLDDSEAEAMMRTWTDEWLREPGLRVLALMPRPWIDETLPLTAEPKAASLQRVFVGRIEVVTAARIAAAWAEGARGRFASAIREAFPLDP